MARPKSGQPVKQKLNLSVTELTRVELELVAESQGMSISAMIAEWAHKEARRLERAERKKANDK